MRDSGRRTPRGAVVRRAANGPKPDASYLTPAEAEAALEQLLTGAVREPTDPRRKRADDHTFGGACEAWLGYVAQEKDRRSSTLGDYRNTARRYLLPEFGADTLLHTIDTAPVDAYRERLLVEGQLSRGRRGFGNRCRAAHAPPGRWRHRQRRCALRRRRPDGASRRRAAVGPGYARANA